MKRISILSALLLMCAMTFAQQALWGGAPVVSPEIHDNNTCLLYTSDAADE